MNLEYIKKPQTAETSTSGLGGARLKRSLEAKQRRNIMSPQPCINADLAMIRQKKSSRISNEGLHMQSFIFSNQRKDNIFDKIFYPASSKATT